MYNSVSLSMRKEVGSELFVLVDSGSVFVVEILYEGLVMWIGAVVGDGLVVGVAGGLDIGSCGGS